MRRARRRLRRRGRRRQRHNGCTGLIPFAWRARWTTGAGTLTNQAGEALGGFLSSGSELDPVTIAIPRSLGPLPEEPEVEEPVVAPGPRTNADLGPPPAQRIVPKGRRVGADGTVRVGSLACPVVSCQVVAPRRVRIEISGKDFWARVLAPKRVGDGKHPGVWIKLPKAALQRLAGGSATVRLRIAVVSERGRLVRVLETRIVYAA